MPSFDIDLSKVPTLKTVPGGIYILRIENIEEKKTQAGNDMLSVRCAIEEPVEQRDEVGVVYINFPLSEKAYYRIRDLFAAVGEVPKGGFDTDDLIGKRFGTNCLLESTPQYGVRNNWDSFFAAEDAKPEALQTQAEVDKMVEEHKASKQAETTASAKGGKGKGKGKEKLF